MPDENEMPMEHIFEALDLMVQAGWVSSYARDAKNTAIQWTEQGFAATANLYMVIDELGPERMNQKLWWAIGTMAMVKFGPGGPDEHKLGFRE